ncbi:MAG: GNAT family N-acetyltransferase, partial [Anaerolineales bacterium]|nr:GNAT family N-acetyltransferase [Anaerolineales bacterium]
EQAREFASVDYQRTMAIVAAVGEGDDEKIIGVARYGEDVEDPDAGAETAVVVEDAYQGRGLGTILLYRLVTYAQKQGIHRLRATVHQSNAQILRFVRRSGLPTEQTLRDGVWDITLSLTDQDLPELDRK